MKKFMLDLTVKENQSLNSQYYLLKLTATEKLPEMLPGQFVEILVDNAPNVFLRRPISINFVDYARNELWLLIQIVGEGTQKMAELKANETVNLIFPLGNSFTFPKDKYQFNGQKIAQLNEKENKNSFNMELLKEFEKEISLKEY